MKQFLKFTLASALGLLIGVFSIILILTLISSTGGSSEVKLTSDHVLKIELNGTIQDRVEEDPLELYSDLIGSSNKTYGLNDLIRSISNAKVDQNIKGIYLELGVLNAGFATLEELRNALIDFKSSGKFIVSYSEVYTQRSYYIASVSDDVCIYPEGGIELKGLNSTITFYTDALAKIGIEPQIIRHGKFKSAVEPFMLTKMSKANREQTELFLGSIWEHYTHNIASDRGISINRLKEIVDNFEVQNTESALKLGLVDQLFYKDELQHHLSELMEKEYFSKVNFVSLKKYGKVKTESSRAKFKKDKIAVIYAQGEIQSGEGSETVIGSERISKAIRTAREDEKVKAIVLRVNSPGGSALASDVIWREAELAQKEKPFVVSMGDVAASGGYYISCGADKIYASPNTITGSIGVFGILMNLEEFYTEKLGLTFDQVKTNKFADIGSTTRSLTKDEKSIIQNSVEDIYDTFTSKVADGREMLQTQVDNIGQGRVWSGVNAKNINLIDAYGGLNDAIEGAAILADLKDYRISELPEQKDPIQMFIEGLEEEMHLFVMKKQLGQEFKHFKTIQDLKHLKGIQARMPYQISID